MAVDVAHPLIPAMPRLGSAVHRAAERIALASLRARWRPGAGRVDLALPDDRVTRLGDGAPLTVRVHDDRLFLRLLVRGELGAGESYVAGEWDADDLVAVLRRFLVATAARGAESPLTWLGRVPELWRYRRTANSRAGSARNIHAHYDLGNDFYRLFLDETLQYSSALWPRPDLTLDQAQRIKLDRLCDLADLRAGEHLLEIGSGWGGLAIHAARTRGCRVTTITVSRAQHQLAAARVAAAGLADRVDVQLRDYRDVAGTFDKIVSVEMLEAVGHRFLPAYFAAVDRALRPGGRAVIQTLTMPDDRYDAYRRSVDWMQTYVFPGSHIPSLGAIRAALGPLAITHSEDIGPDYAPTLAAWRQRFLDHLPAVRALGYDLPFVRTWNLYLAFSEAAFAERTLGNHHLVLTRA